ncbi:MAG: ferritin family protein [Planctomycetota bacterium]|jgi:rubrerythrin
MGVTFNADEVFEMAEQIERNGAKFYRAAAEKFPTIQQILLDLAIAEDEHEKTFKDMRSQLSGREQEPMVFDPDNEAQMYLQVVADGHVFDTKTDPAEQLKGMEIPEDILQTAIKMEKESIAFYAGLKECVPPRAGRDKVEAIIREEFSHIATLNEKLSAL